jgi:hypothetical protein
MPQTLSALYADFLNAHAALEVNALVALELQNLTGFIWGCDFQ